MSLTDEGEVLDPHDAPRALSEDECWARLAQAEYGRVVTTAAGEIDIFTVNHGVSGHTVLFRTAAGTKLVELTIRDEVVFQVDGEDAGEAFSVVVKGRADELQTSREIEAAEDVGVRPWAPGRKDRWVRITPHEVTGRAFRIV